MSFREILECVIAEYRSPKKWIAPALLGVPIIFLAVWLTYFVGSIGLLTRQDFSPLNPNGYLRVILGSLLAFLALLPVLIIATEVLLKWLVFHRRAATVFIASATVVVVVVTGIWAREALASDACLDHGGSFNYATGNRDHRVSYPSIPFRQRHPIASFVAFLAAALAFGVLIESRRAKTAG